MVWSVAWCHRGAPVLRLIFSHALTGWLASWEDYWVWGGRNVLLRSHWGQAKLFTIILRNLQTTKCQEFWSNIRESSTTRPRYEEIRTGMFWRGERGERGAGGDKFYRVQETKYPIDGFVRWKGRLVVKMRDSIGNISISSNWKYFRGIFQSKPKPLEEQ